MFGKANETASMALGGKKKKYSWMTGGGGGPGGSGASTPRPTAMGGGSGTVTPAAPQIDKGLVGRKRTYGTSIEETDIGAKIQVRDFVHVLENDGREKKTLAIVLARLRNTDKDANPKAEFDKRTPVTATR